MNRFLKKEWEDTEIPAEAYLRARNGAWRKVRSGDTRRPRTLIPITISAGAAILILLALAFHRGGMHSTEVQNAGNVSSRETSPRAQAAPRRQPVFERSSNQAALRSGVDTPASGQRAGRRSDGRDLQGQRARNRTAQPVRL